MSGLQSDALPERSFNLGRDGVRIEAKVVEQMVVRLEEATQFTSHEHPFEPRIHQT